MDPERSNLAGEAHGRLKPPLTGPACLLPMLVVPRGFNPTEGLYW